MNEVKTALITGVNGMDGSHLADLLLSKGYVVYGMERRSSVKNRTNTEHLEANPNFHFVIGDLGDSESLRNIVNATNPDEVYNLAAQSFVGSSWEIPLETSDTNGLGVLRLLNAIKQYNEYNDKQVKFYQASTSEMFGLFSEDTISAMKKLILILEAPMVWRNYILIGWLKIIVNLMVCLLVMEFFLIMNLKEEESSLLLEK